jgi:hypothetical protein
MYNPSREEAERDRAAAFKSGVPHGVYCTELSGVPARLDLAVQVNMSHAHCGTDTLAALDALAALLQQCCVFPWACAACGLAWAGPTVPRTGPGWKKALRWLRQAASQVSRRERAYAHDDDACY